jgi:nucleolar MIF4G domain-containing protein 1
MYIYYVVQNHTYVKNITLVVSNWFLLESVGFDFVKEYILNLLEHISPEVIESIISLIQYCGRKIRSENPGNLKIIIDQIKEKVAEDQSSGIKIHIYLIIDEQQKSKINFLVMTLNDLKANKKLNNDPSVRLEFIINWLKKNVI